jgi:hypothetical protein
MENIVGIEMVLLAEATFFLTFFFNKGLSHNAYIKNFLTIFFNKGKCNYNALVVTELKLRSKV